MHKDRHGVKPICTVLTGTDAQIAPSTYYATTDDAARIRELEKEIS